MDPFPGSVGGNVGGFFDLPLDYSPENSFTASLELVCHYYDHGKSSCSPPKWQQQGIAVTESSQAGTRVFIRFAVPEGLPISEPVSHAYHRWWLEVVADLPGINFSTTFELPVFAAGEKIPTSNPRDY